MAGISSSVGSVSIRQRQAVRHYVSVTNAKHERTCLCFQLACAVHILSTLGSSRNSGTKEHDALWFLFPKEGERILTVSSCYVLDRLGHNRD